ncbi:GQ67_00681T0 [Komagataella phaffii]|nr:GQ67_00681T0 [Komagataella phaffii]AOA67731.1 GQ68_00707T0 [Komagataella phaffii GS115]
MLHNIHRHRHRSRYLFAEQVVGHTLVVEHTEAGGIDTGSGHIERYRTAGEEELHREVGTDSVAVGSIAVATSRTGDKELTRGWSAGKESKNANVDDPSSIFRDPWKKFAKFEKLENRKSKIKNPKVTL